MKTILALSLSVWLAPLACAQSAVSSPAVLETIGDVSSESARKALFKTVKKKPNSSACKAGEWEKLGFRHAYEHQSGSKDKEELWAMVQKKCSKVTPDRARYDAGFLEGSIMHCGYERGIMYGYYYNGKKTDSLCEAIGAASYKKGFADGKVITQINDDRHKLRESYDRLQLRYTQYNASISGQPSSVEEENLLAEAARLRDEVEVELTKYESKFRDLQVTYHLKDIYSRRLPDAELSYEIPASPSPMD